MRRILGTPIQFLTYLVFRGFETAVRLLPLPVDDRIGAALGEVAFWFAIPYRKLARRNLDLAFAGEKKEELFALKEMIEEGKIKSIVDKIYPVEQAAEAHRRVETEQRLGIVVISFGTSLKAE